MQQDTFFYQAYPHADPRLQYTNAGGFSAQTDWPGGNASATFVPEVNLNQSQNTPNPLQYANPGGFSAQRDWPGGNTSTFVPGVNLNQSQNAPNPHNFGGSWAHTVPSLMPWVTQGRGPDVPDPVMRFTAPFPPDPCTSQTATSWELLNNLGASTNVNMHLKRKSELDALEASAPNKMCITEEKMSARLRQLHISNQYCVPTESSHSSGCMADKPVTNLQELEAMMKVTQSEGSTKSLVLAPELKKLVEPEKIFASTFLNKIERPSMAVVLWQPQTKLLPTINNNSNTEEDKEPPKSLSSELCAIRDLNSEDIMDT